MGPPDLVSPFVAQKLLDNLTPLLEKLVAFEDTQAASFLLRISFSLVRATHFMRTTPLSHWRSIAITFDSSIRRAFASIVGFPPLHTPRLPSPALAVLVCVRWPFTLTSHSRPAVLRFFRLGALVWVGPLPPSLAPLSKRPLFL